MAVQDTGSTEFILRKIRAIIPALNDNSTLGIKNAQILRSLIILYIANIDPKYGYMGEIDEVDNLRYFTIGKLKKVSKKKGTAYPIEFTGPRVTTPYEICQKDNYVRIKKKPGNHSSFALVEKGMRHCQNLVNQMYDEKYQQRDPMLISMGNQAADKVTVLSNILSVDQFVKRREIQIVLNKYPVFIGRKIEIEELNSFLENPTKSVMLITGEGGTGKTRLVLEFVRHLRDSKDHKYGQHIYFIDPYKEVNPTYLPPNSLLILDDAERKSTYLDHLIDLISNYDRSDGSKLLLIERSIFKANIENAIKEKNSGFDILNLQKGDIIKFLKQNFSSIDEYTCNRIEQDCRCSFDYAAASAEYYRNEGKLSDLRDVLSWKTERYIKDIAERTKSDVADVKYIIQLLSMIMPIDWDRDKYYFKNEFPNLFDIIEKILYGARNIYEDSIILSESHSIFSIQPEPLGDFFRLNALENSKMQNALWNLIPYMPLRIAINIRMTREVYNLSTIRSEELLYKVWNMLNDKRGRSPEFILAISYFSGNISRDLGPSLLNSRRPNINNWLECFYRFYDESRSEVLSGWLTIALVSLCLHYRSEKNFELLDESLQYLNILYKKYGCKEYETLQGFMIGGIRDTNHKVLAKYLAKLELLYSKYPSELHLSYAQLLLETFKVHADNDIVPRPKALYDYIKKLRTLYEKRRNNETAELFTAALVIFVTFTSEHRLSNYVIKGIKELRYLYEKHKNPKIKDYVSALTSAHLFCQLNDLREVDQDFRYLLSNNSQQTDLLSNNSQQTDLLSNNSQQTNLHIRLDDDVGKKIINEFCTDISDYEIHRLENGLFAFAVSDRELPIIDLKLEGTIEDLSMCGHILLSITYKSLEKTIKLIICPLRIINDNMLESMLEDILHQQFDPSTNLRINEARIGLINKRGLSILQNPSLDMSQKNLLMKKEKCTISVFNSKFRTISWSCALVSVLASEGMLGQLSHCPYCRKRN